MIARAGAVALGVGDRARRRDRRIVSAPLCRGDAGAGQHETEARYDVDEGLMRVTSFSLWNPR